MKLFDRHAKCLPHYEDVRSTLSKCSQVVSKERQEDQYVCPHFLKSV